MFEAHSTDYQTEDALRALVEDHFAILKVGPELTFAFREAVFALAAIERECSGGARTSVALGTAPTVLEEAMTREPRPLEGATTDGDDGEPAPAPRASA